MYDYIDGLIIELTPANVVIENSGVGYYINISLNTYSLLSGKKESRIYVNQVIREDAHTLFGFADREERELFRSLITVSGVGANTARVMLSSVTPTELVKAITGGNADVLKRVKGIGLKSAQRIIVDLKDKLGNLNQIESVMTKTDNTVREESLSALVMLGFPKSAVEKVLSKLLSEDEYTTVEDLVKRALKKL